MTGFKPNAENAEQARVKRTSVCICLLLLASTLAACNHGSRHWHSEMPLMQHVAIVQQNFAAGDPAADVRRALNQLDVGVSRNYRHEDWTAALIPSADGVLLLGAALYPPRKVFIWGPTTFSFCFDENDRLLEIWLDRHVEPVLDEDLAAAGLGDWFTGFSEPMRDALGDGIQWSKSSPDSKRTVQAVRLLPPATVLQDEWDRAAGGNHPREGVQDRTQRDQRDQRNAEAIHG